ncbi:MAG: preprotein translocase subunit YajC [Myxococcota bacterium]
MLTILELFASLQPAAAPAAGGGGGAAAAGPAGACAGGAGGLAFPLLLLVVFYFVLIRPQQKQQRERDDMLKALAKGDIVRTNGGIRGEISDLDARTVTLKIADRTKVNVLRTAIMGLDAKLAETEAATAPRAKSDADAKKDGDAASA